MLRIATAGIARFVAFFKNVLKKKVLLVDQTILWLSIKCLTWSMPMPTIIVIHRTLQFWIVLQSWTLNEENVLFSKYRSSAHIHIILISPYWKTGFMNLRNSETLRNSLTLHQKLKTWKPGGSHYLSVCVRMTQWVSCLFCFVFVVVVEEEEEEEEEALRKSFTSIQFFFFFLNATLHTISNKWL